MSKLKFYAKFDELFDEDNNIDDKVISISDLKSILIDMLNDLYDELGLNSNMMIFSMLFQDFMMNIYDYFDVDYPLE